MDIVLFGGFAKGKFDSLDIDLAIILKYTKEKELFDLMKKFSAFFSKDVHLNLVLIETALNNPLLKTLINEGISLIDSNPLYKKIGYESGAIFSLNLTKLKKSTKVLFSYALHGHKNNEGELKRTKGKEIGRAVMFIPSQFIDEFKQFLELWDVEFYFMKVLKD